MIGHRVKIVLVEEPPVSRQIVGVLHRLDGLGATVWRELHALPEQECFVFVPTHRIAEILDLGRPS